MRLLNIKAKKDEGSFKNVPRPKMERANDNQYVLLSREKTIGYLSFIPNWRKGKPLMNQLYIIPSERRKGYATLLVDYFIQRNCDKTSKVWFIAESPNEKGYSLIVKKLGLGEKMNVVCLG